MYMEQNGEQFEEVKGDGSFGMRTRKVSRTPVKRGSLGGSDVTSPNPKRIVEARMAQLRNVLTTPEQLDYRGNMLKKSSSPNRRGGRRSVSKSTGRGNKFK